MESLGEDNFIRVRMGIGKPPHKGMVEDYVLQLLPLEEAERLSEVVSEAAEAIGFSRGDRTSGRHETGLQWQSHEKS